MPHPDDVHYGHDPEDYWLRWRYEPDEDTFYLHGPEADEYHLTPAELEAWQELDEERQAA